MKSDNSKDLDENFLSVDDLKVYFNITSGVFRRKIGKIKAVDGVSFSVKKGTTVGLVGESGSGKTTIGRAIIKLTSATNGNIHYNGKCISELTSRKFFSYRKKIQMIFQDPFNSLNPRMTIYNIIAEPLTIHFAGWTKKRKRDRVAELLEKVELKPDHMIRYPHEFSGGQRQRIGIARALAVEPEFIICDEPVSALDVSVQAQIINLLKDLQVDLNLTYLFIAHDMAVIEHVSDYVLVMERGKIVESNTAENLYKSPKHEYTKQLLKAIPSI